MVDIDGFESVGLLEEAGSQSLSKRSRPKCYHCEYQGCGKSFTRPCRLEEHIRSHTGERPFVCTVENCGKTFLRDSHLKAHMSSHRSERRYRCEQCGHGFNTNQHLKRHMVTHEQRTPYACSAYEGCKAAFRKQAQLRKHIAEVHTHTKPFICTVEGCGRSFGQNSRLKSHEARDHGEQPRYVCGHMADDDSESAELDGTCGARFHTWSGLQKHIKSEHRSVCTECSQVFAKPGVLKQHMRVHEESLEERRRFACDQCLKGFTRRHALTVHVATVHEGQRPFVCEMIEADGSSCGKAFGHKRLLREHTVKAHASEAEAAEKIIKKRRTRRRLLEQGSILDRLAGTGYEEAGRVFGCSVQGCGFRFARLYDLDRHIASLHAGTNIDSEYSVAGGASTCIGNGTEQTMMDEADGHMNNGHVSGHADENTAVLVDPGLL
ncbi:uncharacterized protein V1516DRAFT_630045 [Lipomyces oligophaga]|uniref:uncharacterized protein n=1 Tax=Lipomyces oligophaga TaxID=45792 RepID=UPI0034CF7804